MNWNSCFLLLLIATRLLSAEPTDAEYPPADWGTDHIGKPIPNYVTGDECLFCHRKIGPTWPTNPHQLTVRPKPADGDELASLRLIDNGQSVADQVQFLMNSGRITRFLKRSNQYGKLDLLNVARLPNAVSSLNSIETDNAKSRIVSIDETGKASEAKSLHWQKEVFGDRCAGCHATAVEPKSKAFSAISLDCFTCHGNVSLQHTQDVKKVLLSKSNREPRQVISICGQCHLRGGKSKSTGLPYPNSFVAGDNLFRDFQVNLSMAFIDNLLPVEKHIRRNTRNVSMSGSKMTCLSCHDVHGQSTEKHQELERAAACYDCHSDKSNDFELTELFLNTRENSSHSRICDY